MKMRTEHSDETRAAVMAALLAGQSITDVARTYNIPVGTVKRWSASARTELEPVRSAKRERIGELLVEYLEAGLQTLIVQQAVFRDSTWLKQQAASELAVLHGVIADKQIRLLEALAHREEEAEDRDAD